MMADERHAMDRFRVPAASGRCRWLCMRSSVALGVESGKISLDRGRHARSIGGKDRRCLGLFDARPVRAVCRRRIRFAIEFVESKDPSEQTNEGDIDRNPKNPESQHHGDVFVHGASAGGPLG